MSKQTKADRDEIQRNRDEAYLNGWNDGYAEGFGKATSDSAAEVTRLANELARSLIAEGELKIALATARAAAGGGPDADRRDCGNDLERN